MESFLSICSQRGPQAAIWLSLVFISTTYFNSLVALITMAGTEHTHRLEITFMHQSFVTTTAPTVPGNSGDFDFSPCKALVYAQHCRDIFMVKVLPKDLLKSRQVNVKLLRPVWAWNQKTHSSTALRG